DPGADRWPYKVDRASVHKERGRAVGYAFGVHALQEADVVDMPGDVREEVGHPFARLPVSPKAPEVLHDAMLNDRTIAGKRAGVAKGHHPPIIAREPRLVVERIDLTRATLHEDENDALGLRRMMRRAEPREGRVAGGKHVGKG